MSKDLVANKLPMYPTDEGMASCRWINFNLGYEQSKIFLLGDDEHFWMTIEHNIEGKHPK